MILQGMIKQTGDILKGEDNKVITKSYYGDLQY